MKLRDVPAPDYGNGFDFENPPRSGNAINGLGEKKKRRAKEVFHASGRDQLDWAALETFFAINGSLPNLLQNLRTRWTYRNAAGPVARERVEVADPAAWADAIKAKARELGADIVGITRIEPETDMMDGVEPRYAYAVSIGRTMDRSRMENVPHDPAGTEVLRTYGRVAKTCNALAKHIRGLGWGAVAYSHSKSSDLLQIPVAVRAGLGELGKHGSLICREHGSNVRLGTVMTEMPLALDAPVDIGVDDLCATCRRCTTDCPPGAIFDEKKWVRGEYRWYVDFDRCAPYFAITQGCAICIEVCPWSEPGRGPMLSQKLLAKRPGDKAAQAAE